jgi:chemotaxis response regulator CheB
MVQDPNTAEYPRMPQSAGATGLADYVLAVEQMPKRAGTFNTTMSTAAGLAGQKRKPRTI